MKCMDFNERRCKSIYLLYCKGNLVQQAEVVDVLFHFLSACCPPAELEGLDEILVQVQYSAMDLLLLLALAGQLEGVLVPTGAAVRIPPTLTTHLIHSV